MVSLSQAQKLLLSNLMEISVIMPVLNERRFIPEQCARLLQQDPGVDWEIIFADNGSTDGTLEWLQNWVRTAPVPACVIDASQIAGCAHARNEALRLCKGRYVACCDGDDRVSPQWLISLYALAADTTVVTGPMRRWDSKRNRYRSVIDSTRTSFLGILPFAYGGNVLFPRKALVDCGGWDESLIASQDIDLSWRLLQLGLTMKSHPGAWIDYRDQISLWARFRRQYIYSVYGVILLIKYLPQYPESIYPGRMLIKELFQPKHNRGQPWDSLTLWYRTLGRQLAYVSQYPKWRRARRALAQHYHDSNESPDPCLADRTVTSENKTYSPSR
jgi:glycosyltransferase involved in cell wall biosynthesis